MFFHIHFQELSKIAMPVIFNEPLSFLQRLSEYMEHTHLIHQANATTDSVERMKVPQTLLFSKWKLRHFDCIQSLSTIKWITQYLLIISQFSSVLQHLLCQLLHHSGTGLGNHLIHYWERPMSSSGKTVESAGIKIHTIFVKRKSKQHSCSFFPFTVEIVEHAIINMSHHPSGKI